MPHVIVKLWPGRSEQQKARLAESIAKDVMEEVEARDWADEVYKPDIASKPDRLYKKPGYDVSDLP